MASSQTPIKYIRDKEKVEISGDPTDVKGMIWYDMVTSTVPRIIINLITFFKAPVIVAGSSLWRWIRGKLPLLIPWLGVVGFLLWSG